MACEIVDLVLQDGLDFPEKLEIHFFKKYEMLLFKCLLIYDT